MGQIAGFRGVLGLIYFLTVVAFILVWGTLGGVITLFYYREAIGGFLLGGLIGLVVGWLVGAYLTGVGHTLLSINDHLAALRKGLEEGGDADKKIA